MPDEAWGPKLDEGEIAKEQERLAPTLEEKSGHAVANAAGLIARAEHAREESPALEVPPDVRAARDEAIRDRVAKRVAAFSAARAQGNADPLRKP